ncbi:MAG: 16S rRNA (guanine(527)-N(7))-methyltransferase RsmG, partial [Nitrospirae bacterium]|nr:16S rRNA (guanine(527)-N(7))-methyltransferase RsmG [Nitrospirota bacterium]
METEKKLLTIGLNELGISPSSDVIGRFVAYLVELKKWNRTYNLTALKNNADIITKHFIDSLLYLTAIPHGNWSICDVGSGAGFPGLPIAIVRPDITVTLIEPSRKKVAFLKHMKRLLSLNNVDVLAYRIEEVRDKFFDIAVTRALFSIGDFIKKAGPVLKKEGFLVLNKGPKLEEEIKGLPDYVK